MRVVILAQHRHSVGATAAFLRLEGLFRLAAWPRHGLEFYLKKFPHAAATITSALSRACPRRESDSVYARRGGEQLDQVSPPCAAPNDRARRYWSAMRKAVTNLSVTSLTCWRSKGARLAPPADCEDRIRIANAVAEERRPAEAAPSLRRLQTDAEGFIRPITSQSHRLLDRRF